MFGLSNLGSEQFTTAPAQEDRSLPNPLVVSRTAVPHSHHIQLGLQERHSSFYLLLLFFLNCWGNDPVRYTARKLLPYRTRLLPFGLTAIFYLEFRL